MRLAGPLRPRRPASLSRGPAGLRVLARRFALDESRRHHRPPARGGLSVGSQPGQHDVDDLVRHVVVVRLDGRQARRAVRALAHIVEADHLHVGGNADASIGERADGPEGRRVGEREDAVELHAVVEERRHFAEAVGHVEAAAHDQLRSGLETALAMRVEIAAGAQRLHRLRSRARPTERDDRARAAVEQVTDGGPGAADVVHEHVIEAGRQGALAEQDDRLGRQDAIELGRRAGGDGEDESVVRLEVGCREGLDLGRHRAAGVLGDQADAPGREALRQPLRQLAVVLGGQHGNAEAHDSGAAPAQGSRALIQPVAELVDDPAHALDGLRPDALGAPVDDVGHGLSRNARLLGDVLHRDVRVRGGAGWSFHPGLFGSVPRDTATLSASCASPRSGVRLLRAAIVIPDARRRR